MSKGKIIGLGGQSNNNTPPPSSQQLNIDITAQPTVKCTSCSGAFFRPTFMLKKISKLLTGASADQLVPIQLFVCDSCGEVLLEELPEPLKQEFLSDETN